MAPNRKSSKNLWLQASDVRRQLRDLWTRLWLPKLEHQLAAEYSTAAPDHIAATAYAIAALVEAHWAFHLQGVSGTARRRQLQDAARTLLAQLKPGAQ